jgi:hypothetical protein
MTNSNIKSAKKMFQSSDENETFPIQDLSCEEKTICMITIKYLLIEYPNDSDLGKEVRKAFNKLKV